MRFKHFLSINLQRIPLIDRWLFGELFPPLFFAVSAFTTVSLSVGVMFDLVRKIVESGLPLNVAVQVLILKLPGFLVISFPMAMLMATLLAYSRLSANSELKALRSLGVKTRRMIAPALVLAFLMTGLTFIFNDVIVPNANRTAEVTLKSALGKSISMEKGDDIIYSRFGNIVSSQPDKRKKGLAQLFYAKEFRGSQMKGVTVLDFSRLGYTQMLVANTAIWNESEAKWEFTDGQILTLAPNGTTTTVGFDSYLYPMGTGPRQVAQLPKSANDMTVAQAIRAERLYQESGNRKQARKMKVRIQEKFTLPMACLVFGLIGSSLGAKPNTRTSRSQGFGISVVLILVYYVLSFGFSSLGVKGTLIPFVAAWSPVFISLFGGCVLLRQASR
ncbi:LptF/LptG family permease [Prochlorococcus sp. MIT 1300]|uniref:LptF/LptG family permease n=1 Tax=Prochlorococcus sp. MIT 1300 TaxID=3096218 RepID=UPI002A75AEC8|nr:LptF/LptG family permease [Prochlorococcus sp. MIT 1300]